jgi:hypothetical protein
LPIAIYSAEVNKILGLQKKNSATRGVCLITKIIYDKYRQSGLYLNYLIH